MFQSLEAFLPRWPSYMAWSLGKPDTTETISSFCGHIKDPAAHCRSGSTPAVHPKDSQDTTPEESKQPSTFHTRQDTTKGKYASLQSLELLPLELLVLIAANLDAVELLCLLLTSRTLFTQLLGSGSKCMEKALQSVTRTQSAFQQAMKGTYHPTLPWLPQQSLRIQFFHFLQRDLPAHIHCPDCGILHSGDPSSIVSSGPRKCHIANSPWLTLISSLQMDFRRYNFFFSRNTGGPDVEFEPFSHTVYSASSTMQTCMEMRIVGGKAYLRSQHLLLLPCGASSSARTALSPRYKSQYDLETGNFIRQITSFCTAIVRRFPVPPSRYLIYRDWPLLTHLVAQAVREAVPHEFVNMVLQMRKVRGRGVVTGLVMWYELGEVRYGGIRMVEVKGGDARRIFEGVDGVGAGGVEYRRLEDEERLLKRGVKWVK